VFSPELKKGSMDLLILTILDEGPQHGYAIGQAIEKRSGGRIEFRISTLYQTLYRMERKGWVTGRWIEKSGERRRCVYTLTDEGEKVLIRQRESWQEFARTINDVTGLSHA